MKRLLLCATIAVAMSFASCESFDASNILDRLDNLEDQVDDLKNNDGEHNKIYYTTTDGRKLFPSNTEPAVYGAILISNTYTDGQGVLVFDDTIISIGGSAFYNCTSLATITIPDSVTSIGGSAFNGCSSLISVTIPDSVTSIKQYAFEGCTSLTSVTIGNSTVSIGDYAFYGCTSLTTITIPNSVTSIGYYTFNGCSSLTSVTVPDSVTSIEENAFSDCTSLTRVNITDLSAWCRVSFGNTYANPLCNGAKLYLNGSELTDITIPSDITEIKYNTFSGCTSLTSVTIPDIVSSIGWGAFSDCTMLTNIIIPNSVTSIGGGAFDDCTSLTEVYCKSTTPPAIYCFYMDYDSIIGSFPFNSGMKIYVPRNSYDAYMQYGGYSNNQVAQTNWYTYKSYIEPYDF